MEMAMATLIGTFFFVKNNCTDPCTPGPCGCFRLDRSWDAPDSRSAKITAVVGADTDAGAGANRFLDTEFASKKFV